MTLAAYDGTNAPTVKIQFYKSGTWTDVSATDIRSIHEVRGRQRPDQPIAPGTCTVVLDNHSGIYDPDYTATSTWVVSGASILKAGLQMRVIKTWSATSYVTFVGILETPDLDAGFDATVTFTFTDALAQISSVQMKALPSYQHNLETTATRVGRILTAVGFTGTTSLSGTIQMQSTTEGLNAMTLIGQCVDAQAGDLYISRTGVATLLDLSHKFSRPTQLLFDDLLSTNSVEYDGIKTQSGALQVINNAIVTRGKLKQKTSTYSTSVTKWGLKTFQIEALGASEVHAQNLATYYARKDADPHTTVSQIDFCALALGALYPDFLSCELMDQLTVNRTTVDGRALVMNLVIEGIDSLVTADDWRVSFYTSAMNGYSITL